MDKATFMRSLRADRSEWEALLAEVGAEWMTQPGAAGDWSVKDIIAHVAWGEREMLGVVRARALVGSPYWSMPRDERNAAVYAENRDRALDDVLAEARDVYGQLVQAFETLSDEDFTDASRYREMPAEWEPWQVYAGNTFEHYREHMPSMREWLARQAETR